jgi:hypothetical protein
VTFRSGVTFTSNDGLYSANSNNVLFISDTPVDKNNSSWEIELTNVPSFIAIGVATTSTISHWDTYSQNGLTMLYITINDTASGQVHTNGSCNVADGYRRNFLVNSGNVLKLRFNFASSKLSMENTSNGQYCQLSIPSSQTLYPAVFLWHGSSFKAKYCLDSHSEGRAHSGKFVLSAACKGSPCQVYSTCGGWYCHNGCHLGTYCTTQNVDMFNVNWFCGGCRGVRQWTCCGGTNQSSSHCQ